MNLTNLQTLLSIDRICNLIKYSTLTNGIDGYIVSFGVYKGGSVELLAKFNPQRDIIGIDSFQGLPEATDADLHVKGDFDGVDSSAMTGYFRIMHPNVKLLKGFSPDVFKFFDSNVRFSFVEIDVDMYSSVKDGLDFFFPRMSQGGIILIDDYKQGSTPGCEKAVHEFMSEKTCEYHGELEYYKGVSHKQYLIVK